MVEARFRKSKYVQQSSFLHLHLLSLALQISQICIISDPKVCQYFEIVPLHTPPRKCTNHGILSVRGSGCCPFFDAPLAPSRILPSEETSSFLYFNLHANARSPVFICKLRFILSPSRRGVPLLKCHGLEISFFFFKEGDRKYCSARQKWHSYRCMNIYSSSFESRPLPSWRM